jgi:hypothetical protein
VAGGVVASHFRCAAPTDGLLFFFFIKTTRLGARAIARHASLARTVAAWAMRSAWGEWRRGEAGGCAGALLPRTGTKHARARSIAPTHLTKTKNKNAQKQTQQFNKVKVNATWDKDLALPKLNKTKIAKDLVKLAPNVSALKGEVEDSIAAKLEGLAEKMDAVEVR